MVTAETVRRQLTPLEPLIRRIEGAGLLDPPGKAVGRWVRSVVPKGTVKDAISGVWLGHAVHPMLTDVVIGSFLGASMLDVVAPDGDGRANERLIVLGLAAYVPTAVAGVNDWADSEVVDDSVRRAGLVHAGSNLVAASLYLTSLSHRRRGKRAKGVLFGGLGSTVLMVGGYLGGHLSLVKGVGPVQTVFDPGPSDWTPAADASLLSDGKPTRVVVDETPVLLMRAGGRVYAIHDRCSHRGCSLSEGDVQGDEIVCMCHGSRFDLRDGSLRGGPATSPQPSFQVREEAGRLEVRLLDPRMA